MKRYFLFGKVFILSFLLVGVVFKSQAVFAEGELLNSGGLLNSDTSSSSGASCPIPRITDPPTDYGSSTTTGTGTSSSSIDVAGCSTLSAAVYKALLDSGFPAEGAYGIAGNIVAESGAKPTTLEGGMDLVEDFGTDRVWDFTTGKRTFYCIIKGKKQTSCGFGLAQWTTNSELKGLQTYADELGKPATDPNVQIGYLIRKINYPQYKVNSLDEAAWRMMFRYLRPLSSFCEGERLSSTSQGGWRGCCKQAALNNGTCKYNAESPRRAKGLNLTVAELTAGKAKYAMAYTAYLNRRNKGRQLKRKIEGAGGIAALCPGTSTTSTSTTSEPTETYTVPTGETDAGSAASTTTSGPANTALGVQSSSGLVGQFDSGVGNVTWLNRGDSATVKESGCSLVAILNALKTLKKSNGEILSLADWTKKNISSPSWANTKKMAKQFGLTTSEDLWTSKSISAEKKIQMIRNELYAGRVLIIAGDRSGTNIDCTNRSNISSGDCVFTNGGHYVAIVGITAKNELIVANPGNANDRTWTFPAETVLKYSNLGMSVY